MGRGDHVAGLVRVIMIFRYKVSSFFMSLQSGAARSIGYTLSILVQLVFLSSSIFINLKLNVDGLSPLNSFLLLNDLFNASVLCCTEFNELTYG